MKFKFRLETLLKIRINARTEAQTELAKAQDAERIVEQKIEELLKNIKNAAAEAGVRLRGGQISVDFLIAFRRHEAYLLAQQGAAQEHLVKVQKEVKRRREILMEADKEVKTLEKLKEKQFQESQDKLRLDEMKQIDEIAGQRSALKK